MYVSTRRYIPEEWNLYFYYYLVNKELSLLPYLREPPPPMYFEPVESSLYPVTVFP
jgi:hypothetical protein